MSDDLKLAQYLRSAPLYEGSGEESNLGEDAADTIERLTAENNRNAQIVIAAMRKATEADEAGRLVMSALIEQIEKTKEARNQRDEARASAFKKAEKFLIDQAAEKGGTKTPQGRTAQYYARKIADMAKTPAPANG